MTMANRLAGSTMMLSGKRGPYRGEASRGARSSHMITGRSILSPLRAQPREERLGVLGQLFDVVPAFLHRQHRHAQAGHDPAEALEAGAADGHLGLRVALEDIEAQR